MVAGQFRFMVELSVNKFFLWYSALVYGIASLPRKHLHAVLLASWSPDYLTPVHLLVKSDPPTNN